MQPRILLIRLSSLGDVILTMPLIKALRRKYPEATIDLIVKKEFAGLIKYFPGLSNGIGFDTENETASSVNQKLNNGGYTHVLDLHNNIRSRTLRAISGAIISIVHKRTFDRWLLVKFKVNKLIKAPDVIGRYFETAQNLAVTDNGEAPMFDIKLRNKRSIVAAICPGAKHWNKRWPLEQFQEVTKALLTYGYRIEFHGSANERALSDQIAADLPIGSYRNRCGEVQLHELPEIFATIKLAITNDSGLMHLASAAGCNTISIFGPTVREFGFMPRSKKAVVLENAGLDCRPCTTIGLDNCPKGHFKCMKEVTSTMVLEVIPVSD